MFQNDSIIANRFLCITAETGSMVDVRLVTNDGDSSVPKEEVEKVIFEINSLNSQ